MTLWGSGRGWVRGRARWASPGPFGGAAVEKAVGRNGSGNRAAGQGDEGAQTQRDCCLAAGSA